MTDSPFSPRWSSAEPNIDPEDFRIAEGVEPGTWSKGPFSDPTKDGGGDDDDTAGIEPSNPSTGPYPSNEA